MVLNPNLDPNNAHEGRSHVILGGSASDLPYGTEARRAAVAEEHHQSVLRNSFASPPAPLVSSTYSPYSGGGTGGGVGEPPAWFSLLVIAVIGIGGGWGYLENRAHSTSNAADQSPSSAQSTTPLKADVKFSPPEHVNIPVYSAGYAWYGETKAPVNFYPYVQADQPPVTGQMAQVIQKPSHLRAGTFVIGTACQDSFCEVKYYNPSSQNFVFGVVDPRQMQQAKQNMLDDTGSHPDSDEYKVDKSVTLKASMKLYSDSPYQANSFYGNDTLSLVVIDDGQDLTINSCFKSRDVCRVSTVQDSGEFLSGLMYKSQLDRFSVAARNDGDDQGTESEQVPQPAAASVQSSSQGDAGNVEASAQYDNLSRTERARLLAEEQNRAVAAAGNWQYPAPSADDARARSMQGRARPATLVP